MFYGGWLRCHIWLLAWCSIPFLLPPTHIDKNTNKYKQMRFLWFFLKLPYFISLTNSGISTKKTKNKKKKEKKQQFL